MKVSIIIPAYNAANKIKRCIDSITNQTYDNIEIIVVNDGSNDNTSEIVKRIKDDRIVLIEQANAGVSTARNTGIAVSTGDLIMFADADDELQKNAVKIMQTTIANENVDIVKCVTKEIFADKTIITTNDILSNKKILHWNNSSRNSFIENFFGEKAKVKCLVMTLMIKRDFLYKNNIRFEPSLFMMEDVVFYADLLNHNAKIKFIEEPLYNYYQNAGSALHDKTDIDRTIRGVLDTNHELIQRIPNSITVNNRHFMILFNLCSQKKRSTQLKWISAIRNVAKNAIFNNKKFYWKISREAIIKNRRISIIVLLELRRIKRLIKSKEKYL